MAKSNKPKKPFYKRWWFWLIIVILVFGALGSNSSSDDSSSSSSSSKTEKKSSSESSKSSSSKSLSSSESSSDKSTNTASTVKSMLKPLIGKDNIKSIKILGFDDINIAGGSAIIVTDDFSNVIESKTIDSIIADVCQKLSSDPSVTGTGIVIKIVSPDPANEHNVMTGHANIDSKDFSKINADNVQNYAKDYDNKGDQFMSSDTDTDTDDVNDINDVDED